MTESIIVNPPHWYYRPDHLTHVIAEMQRRGAPVLRAAWDKDACVWHAREGTHRLRAAKALGLAPILIPVRWHCSPNGRQRARFAAQRSGHLFDLVEVRR